MTHNNYLITGCSCFLMINTFHINLQPFYVHQTIIQLKKAPLTILWGLMRLCSLWRSWSFCCRVLNGSLHDQGCNLTIGTIAHGPISEGFQYSLMHTQETLCKSCWCLHWQTCSQTLAPRSYSHSCTNPKSNRFSPITWQELPCHDPRQVNPLWEWQNFHLQLFLQLN